MTDRQSNHDSERVVVGRAIAWPQEYEALALDLRPQDFHLGAHSAIWTILAELTGAGEPINVPLIKGRLGEQHHAALAEALNEGAIAGGIAPQVREVQRCALTRRQLAELGDLSEDLKAGRGAARAQVLLELENAANSDEHYQNAAEFIYGERSIGEGAVWGRGEEILWASGEPFYIVGPTGVGKTTLTQQIVCARLGLRDEVLGMPVEMHSKRLLYLACDRPNQVRRAFRRVITTDEADAIDGELILWEGPPPVDFGTDPRALYAMARSVDADTVVIDSIKDVVLNVNEPAQGQAFNQAMQICVANGVEVLALHHTRKRVPGVKQGIDDVYGGWIAAGAGSIVMLNGEPGDSVVTFSHLKQPQEQVGPWKIRHDHMRGETTIDRNNIDIVKVIGANAGGRTPADLAQSEKDDGKPSSNEVAKMQRRCERLVESGTLVRLERDDGTRYAVAART